VFAVLVVQVGYSGGLNIVLGVSVRLLVDLGQELVVAEERVLLLADLDGAAAELELC
jgi:hypothetical protein